MNPKGVIATTIRSLNDVGSEGAAALTEAILEDLAVAGYEVREKAAIDQQRGRLARHLYEKSLSENMTPAWDRQPDYVRENWFATADVMLAVIAGVDR